MIPKQDLCVIIPTLTLQQRSKSLRTKYIVIIINSCRFYYRAEFAGENFVRFSGDTTKHSQAQLFAWEAHGKGVDVHLLAEPTKLELLQKEYDKKKEQFKSSVSYYSQK